MNSEKTWRLIIDGPRDAATNMAIDKAIMKMTEIPTVRFYQWDPPAVSIGYFQNLEGEVDIKRCEELGIGYIRRITGGGAVFHDKEVTYSISIPEENSFFSKDLHESYKAICGAIISGFKNLGLNAEYSPLNDIVINNKKISGCAQTRREKKLLQHGTLLMAVDPEKMFSVLKVPDEKIKDKLISSIRDRVTSVSNQLGKNISYIEMVKAMRKGFEDYFGILFLNGELTEEEKKLSQEIKKDQFDKKEWNYAR